MITIFTIPKPFDTENTDRQINAIQSWLRLSPRCEVLVLIEDDSMMDDLASIEVRVLSGIDRNEFGTPFIGHAFDRAKREATNDLLCYINSDMILTDDFTHTVALAKRRFGAFLIVGQRTDLDLPGRLTFEINWDEELRTEASVKGTLHPPQGIDYFVFPSTIWKGSPDFVVGRPGWDNWFVYDTHRHKIPVIDATASVLAIHQNHDYRHVPSRHGAAYEGPEAVVNRQLAGPVAPSFNVHSATWKVREGRIVKANDPAHLRARMWGYISGKRSLFLVARLLASMKHRVARAIKRSTMRSRTG